MSHIFKENMWTWTETIKLSDKKKLCNVTKGNLSKNERKALKELQSDTSVVILPADKGRSTVILNHEDYLEKCMDHINNGPIT